MWTLLQFLIVAALAQDAREGEGEGAGEAAVEDKKRKAEPESYTIVQVQTFFSEEACYSGKPPLHTRSELMLLPEALGDHTCEDHQYSGIKGLKSREYKCTDPIEEGVSMLLVMDYSAAECGWGVEGFHQDLITNVLWVMQGECFFDNRLNQLQWVKWSWKGVCGAEEVPEDPEEEEDAMCDAKTQEIYAAARVDLCGDDIEGEASCECLLTLGETMQSFIGTLNCLMNEDSLTTVQTQMFLCERFVVDDEPSDKCRGRSRQECKADQDLCIWYKAGEKCFDVGLECTQAFNKKECRNLNCFWSTESDLCLDNDTNAVCTSFTKKAKCNKTDDCEWNNDSKKCCSLGPYAC